MSKLAIFLKQYPVFALIAVTMILGLIAQLSGHSQLTQWLLVAVSFIAVIQIIIEMSRTIRQGGLGLDILALTAIVVGMLLGEYWAAIVIALMLTGGEALEDYAQRRATYELRGLLDRAPKKAHVVDSKGRTADVRVEAVRVGAKVLVKPGEVIPVDGVILEGITSVDESSLTGESLPTTKQPNDTVLSGSINVGAAITMQALHTSQDSQYAQIVKLVKEATSSKSPFVRLADRYSLPFTVVSFIIAFAAWGISGEVVRFLEVIVVATPCPLLIGAPVAIISGMSRAAKHGIIIKNGASLERLASIKSLAFDKTGTLTRGEPVLKEVHVYGDMTEDALLGLAAAIEAKSAHVLAAAVTAAARARRIKPAHVTQVEEKPGLGLQATWKNQPVLLGTYAFLEEYQVDFPADFSMTHDQTTTFIAINGQLIGNITFTDEIRPEAAKTVAELRGLGIRHILMLTGDNPEVALSIAGSAGISEVRAGLLPAAKVSWLKHIDEAHRPSGMVGDGVNDAPVLAASDVGIALGARGSTAASESADVVIMLDDLHKVARAVTIAKDTLRIGLQSIWIGIGISVGLMLVFATGHFSAVLGAALQEIVDVVVIINALRAHGSLQRTFLHRLKVT